MTMQEIRKAFTSQRKFNERVGLADLNGYSKQMQSEVELLWKEGYIEFASDELLAYANGYQISTGDYENIEIRQTYGLRSITATKEVAREIARAILCI